MGGMDYAGVVLACGPDCEKLKVGDRVCGITKPFEYQPGTWAEQTTAPEKDVVKIEDDSISFVDAAAVTMGVFVDQAMIELAKKKLSSGAPRCLVIGASGALGGVMVQLLKSEKYKAHVTAVCSGKNAEKVHSNGADEVIDYTTKVSGQWSGSMFLGGSVHGLGLLVVVSAACLQDAPHTHTRAHAHQ